MRQLTGIREDLERLRGFAAQLRLPDTLAHLERRLRCLERGDFTVAFVGEFSRGKSTLVNALAGAEYLPADILPGAALKNRVAYAETAAAEIVYRDGRRRAMSVPEMHGFVSSLWSGAAESAAAVEAAVRCPASLCRERIVLIDAPGLEDEQEDVTRTALQEADLVVLVLSAHFPFSETERDFVERDLLRADPERILFAVTAIDNIEEEEPGGAALVLEHVRERVREHLLEPLTDPELTGAARRRIGEPRIFGVSGADALDAAARGDEAALERSGVPALARAVEALIAGERESLALAAALNCADSASAAVLAALGTGPSLADSLSALRAGQKEEALEGALSFLKGRLQAELRNARNDFDRLTRGEAAEDETAPQRPEEIRAAVARIRESIERARQAAGAGAASTVAPAAAAVSIETIVTLDFDIGIDDAPPAVVDAGPLSVNPVASVPRISEVIAMENISEQQTDASSADPAAAPAETIPAATAPAERGKPLSLSSFGDYKRVVLSLATDLRELRETAVELKMEKAVELLDDVLRRLENNQFSIAVVGEFKRGKSTFINALLGKEILPADIMPCSATLNRVTYGLRPMVLVKFKDGHEEEVEIDKLADYVTKLTPEAEELAASIEEAVVQYPVPYCQNNVDIIDTPGLNDNESMTSVTLGVLPQVDAAVMVIMALSPFSEYERDFLENRLMTSDLGRVLFVVTAIDRLNTPSDADRIVENIRSRIKKNVLQRAAEQYGEGSEEYEVYIRKIGEPKVFGLSAYQALQARNGGDPALVETSRFPQFEEALEKFLSEDRGAIFLQVPVNRILSTAEELLAAISIREGSLKMKKEEFAAAHEASLKEIETLRVQKVEEMKKIDQAAARIEDKVRPLVDAFDVVMKEAASRFIDGYEVRPADLMNKSATDRLSARIGQEVAKAVQEASQKQAEKIQTLVQKGVAGEVDRLKEFSDSVNQVISGVELQFSGVSADSSQRTAAGEGIAAAISGMTGLGGIWSGYRVAGVKGAATGGAASFATALGVGVVVALVGAPVTLPLLVATGVASVFTGGWMTRAIFKKESIDNYKNSFKQAVYSQIDEQIQNAGAERRVQENVNQTFALLKDKVQKEVEATLNDTETTLADMRVKLERDETLTVAEAEQFARMREKLQGIYERADHLNDQLFRIVTGGQLPADASGTAG